MSYPASGPARSAGIDGKASCCQPPTRRRHAKYRPRKEAADQ
jgi:hypothetical protein